MPALVLTALVVLLPFSALAKGNFAFIVIQGGGLSGEVRTSDPALTDDFFAFHFPRPPVSPPLDPGPGYEITRYYVDGNRQQAFDHLHYYPGSGLVYYDGLINGSSEYDRKWFTARPEIKGPFQRLLAARRQPAPGPLMAAATFALLLLLAFAVRLRQPAPPAN